LEEALKGDNKEEIEAKIQKLTETSSELAQRMYAEQAQADESVDPGPESDPADTDAVDAEFEEVKDDKQA
jgi:molecular chaperone DnaK